MDWAKAEVFSSSFFILFGVLFFLASYGFWKMGQTELAKAFVYPTLVAGVLLLIIGIGLVYSNKSRIASFPSAYEKDASAFLKSEIERSKDTVAGYNNVLRVVPMIILIAALLIVFMNTPMWRAISITTIGMMVCILIVDSNAQARIEDYNKKLVGITEQY